METIKLYSMYYDNKDLGNSGLGDYLGEFRHVRQLREDFYVDDFIAVNTKTNELCLILSREIKGVGGGLSYSVHPMKTLGDYKIKSDIGFAKWNMTLDDFDDGLGNRELPHCSKCGRGVYIHDASLYCPFCGTLMKNPMRY